MNKKNTYIVYIRWILKINHVNYIKLSCAYLNEHTKGQCIKTFTLVAKDVSDYLKKKIVHLIF